MKDAVFAAKHERIAGVQCVVSEWCCIGHGAIVKSINYFACRK